MHPLLLPVILLWPAFPCPPAACTCLGRTPVQSVETARQALRGSGAVFVARVEHVDVRVRLIPRPDSGRPPLRWREAVVRLRVERRFKGQRSDTLTVLSGLGGGDCGVGFATGRRYLVYIPARDTADSTQAGKPPYVSDCDGTKALEDARAEIRYLERARRRSRPW